MVTYADTLVLARPRRVAPLIGLPLVRDPRLRCTLVLGDGFTQGFLRQSFANVIPSALDNHFPPPADVSYLPTENDGFDLGELWCEEKWPQLFRLYVKLGKPAGREFYQHLAEHERLRPTGMRGAIGYSTTHIGFELRSYLWHFFRAHHFWMTKAASDSSAWAWKVVLPWIATHFSLGVVTFNYDLLFELIVQDLLRLGVRSINPFGTNDEWINTIVNMIPTLKVHGSISHYIKTLLPTSSNPANPWLEELTFERTSVADPDFHLDLSMRHFPELPDLIPPGHLGGDWLFANNVLQMSRHRLHNSSAVVFCGLSAREPDTGEVEALVESIKDDTTIVQVGLRSQDDDTNDLARLLKARNLQVRFLDAADVSCVPDAISHLYK